MAKHNPYQTYSEAAADDLGDLLGEDSCGQSPADDGGQNAAQEHNLTEDQLRQLADKIVCPHCDERKSADEERLRAYAEMDNFKKRLQREQQEQSRYAAEKVLADMLPILDNMELALRYGGNESCKPVLMGVEMTYKLMLDALRRHGLEPVGETGEVFDPFIHEAVGNEEVADMEPGLVSQLMQRGYKLGDRLLRPAKVMVSR